jgi:hypothetical protein
MKIPKIAHTIWVGEVKRMPDQNIRNFLKCAHQNPDLTFNLWIDSTKLPPGIHTPDDYRAVFKTLAEEITQEYPEHPIDQSVLDRIKIRDIESEGVSSPYVRYEIDRLRPNYGAASDLLRYEILFKEGGFYFDSDVGFGEIPIRDTGVFDDDSPYPRFYFDWSYKGMPGVPINDFLLATPQNLFVKFLRTLSEHHYQGVCKALKDPLGRSYKNTEVPKPFFLPVYEAHCGDESNVIEETTIRRTGPESLHRMVQDIVNVPIQYSPGKSAVLLRSIEKQWRTYPPNHRAWCEMPVLKMPSADTSIERALKAMEFEVNVMKFLALDTHIQNILDSCDGFDDKAAIIGQFFTKIRECKKKFKFNGLQGIQLTFQNPQVLEFYKKMGIPLYKTFTLPYWDKKQMDHSVLEERETLSAYYAPVNEILEHVDAFTQDSKMPISKAVVEELTHGLLFMNTFFDEYSKIRKDKASLEAIRDYLRMVNLEKFIQMYNNLSQDNRVPEDLQGQMSEIVQKYSKFCNTQQEALEKLGMEQKSTCTIL